MARCTLSPTRDGLRVEARIEMPAAGGEEVMVIEPGQPDVWVSETDTKRDGDAITGTSELVHVDGGAIALDRGRIRLTVLGSGHAVDIRGCTSG